mmetsp:Transcript_6951/g.19767  ORF Transcript_6951/g.19767 Transcript_6951/m.19767 type:complete len:141 (+) Transcript_6951:361-783(+)
MAGAIVDKTNHGILACHCHQGAWTPAKVAKALRLTPGPGMLKGRTATIDHTYPPTKRYGTAAAVMHHIAGWAHSKDGYAILGGQGRHEVAANCQTFVADMIRDTTGHAVKAKQHRLLKAGGKAMKAVGGRRRRKSNSGGR